MDPEEQQAEETGRNPTQERIDEEGADPRPVDVDWGNEPAPHEREEDTEPAA